MLKTEVVDVSPRKALEFLQTMKVNRRVKRELVALYARDMKAGNWKLTHQGISFNSNGELNDGQHRLLGITQAGVTLPMLVTHGVDDPEVLDSGCKRSVADAAHYNETWAGLGTKQAATAKILLVGAKTGGGNQLSHTELARAYQKYQKGIDFANNHVRNRVGVTAAVKAVIARAFFTQNEDRLREFCDILNTGVVSKAEDSAALKLRDRLLSGARGEDAYQLTQAALKHFTARNPISLLKPTGQELFTLPE